MEFDGTYNWALLHLSEEVAHGEKNAHDLEQWMKDDLHNFGTKPFRMTMITNHDENAWNGTVFERYGEGHQAFAVFIFTAYGIPMLYSGQEVGLDKRLKFFDKDTIDWSDPKGLQPFYKKLVRLKKENPALWHGAYGGMPERINQDERVFAFVREDDGNQVIGIINFSGEEQDFNLRKMELQGTYTDYFTGETIELSSDQPLTMDPWQYLIFTQDQ
jgi:hypothetical protein